MHNAPLQPLSDLHDEVERLKAEKSLLRTALAQLIQVDETSTPRNLEYYQQVLNDAKKVVNETYH